MTDTDDPLRGLLAEWPGRFRFPGLMLAFSDGQLASLEQLALAGLEGIAADHDEYRACAGLISDGEFLVAEEAISECRALETSQIEDLRKRLSRRRAECLQSLLGRVQRLVDRASAADVAVVPEQDALTALCTRSWSRVEERLLVEEQVLERALDEKRDSLRQRYEKSVVQDGETDLGSTVAALLKTGHLRAVELMLTDGAISRPGPEGVPPLRGWARSAETPHEILRWHLNPLLRPTGYVRWKPVDEQGQELLEAFDALGNNNESTAAQFACALTRFLSGQDRPAPAVHRVEGGYLTTITGVFAAAETARFRPTGSVELFVAAPEAKEYPDLDLRQPYIAVGHSLQASDSSERTTCAVLDLGHLVELVTLSSRVPIQVLRVLGRQWPLDVFTGGSATSLEALLGNEPGERWHVLRWIVDLAGLGDLTTADALLFQAGPDLALLHLFLEFLALPKAAVRSELDAYGVVRDWARDPSFARTLESAALTPIADSPGARVAFWAALSAAVPGQPVTLDEILLCAASVAGGDMPDDDLEPEIRQGLAQLAALPLVVGATSGEVRFHRCGVLLILGGDADRRLQKALLQLAEESASSRAGLGEVLRPGDWRLYRHLLRPELRRYEELAATAAAPVEELLAASRGLAAMTGEPPSAVPVDGDSDLAATLLEMRESFTAHYPQVTLDVHGPDSAPVAISPAGLRVILYEVLTNAAEAAEDNGEQIVRATVTPAGTEFVVDIQDSGKGLPYPEGSEYRVFRDGESTRGPDRGHGLHIARRLARKVDGDLSVRARALAHPVLRGAHFQLLLPVAIGEPGR
ncbi:MULTISPECIES: ATP-binding protein [unclassified Streptomyces]|uniref:ATP-binding protein n=1 Tax=unclassified Streptomyces TaxID=2593676 RepID=UPI0016517983|nr:MULTISPECIES: ATP-binding protein [unclassified Streptomyces]